MVTPPTPIFRDDALDEPFQEYSGRMARAYQQTRHFLSGTRVKTGFVLGATDELGYAGVDQVVTVHDPHATMLECLGIRHDAFSVKFQGRDGRLSGVEGAKVIGEILG
jgi:hypothetical protein